MWRSCDEYNNNHERLMGNKGLWSGRVGSFESILLLSSFIIEILEGGNNKHVSVHMYIHKHLLT